MNELETKVAALKEEMAAAKQEAAAAKEAAAAFEQKMSEKDTEINNLDASIKEQKAELDALREQMKAQALPKGWKAAFRAELEKQRPAIEAALSGKADRYKVEIELKTIYDVGTGVISGNAVAGVDLNPEVVAAAPVGNAFIAVLGIRPRRGNKIAWIEGTPHSAADYVAELASAAGTQSDVTFTEVTRAFGKVATWMRISTEIEDWFEQVYNFCVNEGSRMVDAKIDNEIFNGAGDDSTYPNKVYGLKSSDQSTAYTPIAAGSIKMANAADVLLDARLKINQAGYNANVAFVSFAIEAALKGLKNSIGGLLYNEYTGMLNGLRIVPSARLQDGEALVMDTNCAEVYGGNSYELEFTRNGLYDAYDVYFRKAAQVKVAATRKAGILYIESMAASIALLDDGTSVTLTLSDSTKSIVKGAANAYQIEATVSPAVPVIWTSSDTTKATVAQDGTVTGVAAGTAIILAEAGNAKAFCVVTITNS